MASSPKRAVLWTLFICCLGAIASFAVWDVYAKRAGDAQAAALPVYGDVGEFAFTNFDQQAVSNDTLRGKIWVVDFIFTTCPGLCPVMSSAMQTVQKATATNSELGSDTLRLVSISTDPKIDTLDRLRAYAEQYRADVTRWHLVRGDFAAVQKFSQNALRLGLERASPEQIKSGAEKVIHSNKFVLIDRVGRVRGHYSGTSPREITQLISDLSKLASESVEGPESAAGGRK